MMAKEAQYTDQDLLHISGLQHILFCRRRAALVYNEGLWRDNVFTTTGTINQQRIDSARLQEKRPGVKITRGLLVRSYTLGLTGKCDIVEFHSDPAAPAELTPFPIEHKRGAEREEPGYEMQLCAQAICIEEMTGLQSPRGAIYFATSNRRHEVEFTPRLRRQTGNAARALHKLAASRRTPPARYEAKCEFCSMINICQPRQFPGLPATLSQLLQRQDRGEEQ